MLARPQSTDSQSAVLQDRWRIAQSYPVCELWLLLQQEIVDAFDQLSPQGMLGASRVAQQIAKVLGWIEGQGVQSVLAFNYLGRLWEGAHAVQTQAKIASLGATGAGIVTLDSDAVSALSTLQTWDDVLGNYIPADPADLGRRLVLGCEVTT